MDAILQSKYGDIKINPKFIAKTAGLAACESFGVVGMASVSIASGIAKLLSGDELTKGVMVEVVDNEIIINLHIIIAYSVNVKACTDNVIENVKYQVEETTKLRVKQINIYVEGIRLVD